MLESCPFNSSALIFKDFKPHQPINELSQAENSRIILGVPLVRSSNTPKTNVKNSITSPIPQAMSGDTRTLCRSLIDKPMSPTRRRKMNH